MPLPPQWGCLGRTSFDLIKRQQGESVKGGEPGGAARAHSGLGEDTLPVNLPPDTCSVILNNCPLLYYDHKYFICSSYVLRWRVLGSGTTTGPPALSLQSPPPPHKKLERPVCIIPVMSGTINARRPASPILLSHSAQRPTAEPASAPPLEEAHLSCALRQVHAPAGSSCCAPTGS